MNIKINKVKNNFMKIDIVNNLKVQFRLIFICIFFLGIGFAIYDELNPYVFPSNVALYLDEIDYLELTIADDINIYSVLIIYILLFLFVPYSNYLFLFYLIGFTIYDWFFSNDAFQIYSPLFQIILDIIYMLFGIQIYLMFFTSLKEKFKFKNK